MHLRVACMRRVVAALWHLRHMAAREQRDTTCCHHAQKHQSRHAQGTRAASGLSAAQWQAAAVGASEALPPLQICAPLLEAAFFLLPAVRVASRTLHRSLELSTGLLVIAVVVAMAFALGANTSRSRHARRQTPGRMWTATREVSTE
jgi:hypothetical protein